MSYSPELGANAPELGANAPEFGAYSPDFGANATMRSARRSTGMSTI